MLEQRFSDAWDDFSGSSLRTMGSELEVARKFFEAGVEVAQDVALIAGWALSELDEWVPLDSGLMRARMREKEAAIRSLINAIRNEEKG